MAAKQSYTWPIITIIVGILLVLIVIPEEYKRWAPSFIQSPTFHLGLDLAGGTQLDFRISEQEMNDQIQKLEEELSLAEGDSEKSTILKSQIQAIKEQKLRAPEAIRDVLEKRINSLGVSETTITPSTIGDEKHLLIECPHDVDIQNCINTVGKTITLEFKEEFTEVTEEFEQGVRTHADDIYNRITQNNEKLQVIGQDLSKEIGIIYQDESQWFKDQMPKELIDLWDKNPDGTVVKREAVVTTYQPGQDGQPRPVDVPGIFLAEITQPRTMTGRTLDDVREAFPFLKETEEGITYNAYEERILNDDVTAVVQQELRTLSPGNLSVIPLDDGSAAVIFLRTYKEASEKMTASHILIAWEGAVQAPTSVTRTKEEALKKAQDILIQAKAGINFANLAQENSDGPSRAQGGSVGEFKRGDMAPSFEEAAFAMKKGDISDIVETQFGYHIIKAETDPQSTMESAGYDELIIAGTDALARAESLKEKMEKGDIKKMEEVANLRTLFLSLKPSGWKDTELDGKHFRSASVTLDSVSNQPVVQISFDDEGAKLFAEITKKNINKRIAIFVGGELITAPTVQAEITGGTAVITGSNNIAEARKLAQDLNTGAIPAPIYLSGQRTIEATLGKEAFAISLKAGLYGLIALMIFMLSFYRLLGLMANISLIIYIVIFTALLKLPLFLISKTYIVLSLAGMAGIILSIGMAVDANVLIFERIKEELRKGKELDTAIRIGFTRAWPSIRDGNASTFITCAILFFIGTSIVRGFAITLATGVLLSMFTAIVITRWFINYVIKTKLKEKKWLFCG